MKLRYEGSIDDVTDFWLFYLDRRIHPCGWSAASQNKGYIYKPPDGTSIATILYMSCVFIIVNIQVENQTKCYVFLECHSHKKSECTVLLFHSSKEIGKFSSLSWVVFMTFFTILPSFHSVRYSSLKLYMSLSSGIVAYS